MFARWMYRLWSQVVATDKLWRLLDGTGIVVFVGPNGSGKSLVMVESATKALGGEEWVCFEPAHRHHRPFKQHALDCIACDPVVFATHKVETTDDFVKAVRDDNALCLAGAEIMLDCSTGIRKVYSTVPLTARKGVPHPLYVPLTSYPQLMTIEHADVLFDEVAGIADASSSSSIPVQIVNWEHQLRKRDIRQRVTTPAYARCALPIRQVAQVVVEMRSYFPASVEGRLWRQRRLVYAVAYDARSFDDFIASDGQREKLSVLAKGLVWVPTSQAIQHYSSTGAVLQLGHVTEGGLCMSCGGSRSRPKCACEDDHDGCDASELVIETTVSGAGTRTKKAVRVSPDPASDEREQIPSRT